MAQGLARREFLRRGAICGAGLLLPYLDSILPAESYAGESVFILVDLENTELNLLENEDAGTYVRKLCYPVAVGSSRYPTPSGDFEVHEIIRKPDWYPPKGAGGEYRKWVTKKHRKIASAHGGRIPYGHPENPMGECKISLRNEKTGGIETFLVHGKGDGSVGRGVSHGCIRMRDRDILELADRVYKGIPVRIRLDATDL